MQVSRMMYLDVHTYRHLDDMYMSMMMCRTSRRDNNLVDNLVETVT